MDSGEARWSLKDEKWLYNKQDMRWWGSRERFKCIDREEYSILWLLCRMNQQKLDVAGLWGSGEQAESKMIPRL